MSDFVAFESSEGLDEISLTLLSGQIQNAKYWSVSSVQHVKCVQESFTGSVCGFINFTGCIIQYVLWMYAAFCCLPQELYSCSRWDQQTDHRLVATRCAELLVVAVATVSFMS